MKAAPFSYYDPKTVDEAAELLGRLDNVRVLAGGQSLMPLMNFRYVTPDHVIDLNGVKSLFFIHATDSQLTFGAMTRQCDIEFSPVVQKASPIIIEALQHVGHRQTRNRGTIGGSLCHLDPSAELANMAALHDATLEICSGRGNRTIPMDVFAKGFMTTDILDGEFLQKVTFQTWPVGHGYAFEEVARRHGDFAIAAVGVLIALDRQGAIDRAAIALSGIGPVPTRLHKAELALKGARPSHETFRAAAVEAQAAEALDDVHVSASYRQHLARVLTYRALERAALRASSHD